MKKLKNLLIVIVVIAIIVAILVNIVKKRISAYKDVENSYSDNLFTIHTVSRGDVVSYARSSGNITSFNIEALKFEIGDQIKEILVSEGQMVNANQDIMKVVNDGKERIIKAGISGKFFFVEKDMGDTQYCIYNIDDVGVKVTFSEKDIANISIGQKAIINVPALEKDLEGTVSYIASLPQNERYAVRIKINYTDDVKFGYSSNVSVVTLEKNNVITVPYAYVSMTDDGRYYVLTDACKDDLYNSWMNGTNMEISEEKRTYIKTGVITSKTVEVTEGIEEGQSIIKLAW